MITVEFSGVYVGSVCLNEDILAELYLEDIARQIAIRIWAEHEAEEKSKQ